jgi:hypothetical protein
MSVSVKIQYGPIFCPTPIRRAALDMVVRVTPMMRHTVAVSNSLFTPLPPIATIVSWCNNWSSGPLTNPPLVSRMLSLTSQPKVGQLETERTV